MTAIAGVIIEFLTTENGGRRTPICLSREHSAPYRPHFRVRGGNGELLGVEFIEGPDQSVPPGGKICATVAFLHEKVCYDPLTEGAEFEVLEGSRVVATARVICRRKT